jgi:TP901 family phage tail tape measure protein
MASLTDSRKAIITLGMDTRPLEKGVEDAKKKLGLFGKMRKLITSGTGTAVGNLMSGAFSSITSGVMDAASEVMDFERNLTRLQIAGGRNAASMGDLRDKIAGVSKDTSIARGQLLAGASAYVRMTGDLNGAETALQTFGDVAIASGSSMEDVAMTAAALKQNLKINPKDFGPAFDVLITQGKAGAIEMNELATLMSGLAPTLAKFKGGTGLSGMATGVAAMQVSRQAFGSAAEAATGLRAFATAVARNASKFKKGTVFEVGKDGVKRMRSLKEIIDSIAKSDIGQDQTKLIQALGSDEAQRWLDSVIKGRTEIDKMERESLGSNATALDKAAYQASPAGKLEKAFNTLKVTIAEAFTTERIEGFVNAAAKLAGWLGTAAGFVDYLGDRMVDWERKQKPIEEKAERGAERRQRVVLEKFGDRGKLTESQEGYLYGVEAGGGDVAAERKKLQEENILKSLTDKERAEIGKQTRNEARIREALGGDTMMGAGGVETALSRGPTGQIGVAAALGLVTKGDAPDLIQQQAIAISKAMAREIQDLKIDIEKDIKNVPTARVVKRKGGGKAGHR